MSLNDMYSRKDLTEVPSYGLLSALGNMATSAGSSIANGASALASGISKIPVVGDVIGGGVKTLGSGMGQLVSGNVSGGLGSLYTGVDKLVGGVLPGGQAFGSGYLGNLYGQADRAMGGYLPNIGGVGATPAQMSGAALSGYGAPAGTTTGVNSAGQAVSYAPGANPAAAKPGFFAKGGGLDNLANKIQLGMGLYGLTQKTPENTNRQAYGQLIQPGVGGAGNGSPIMVSPKRPSSDPAMKSAPKVAGVNYGDNTSGELSSDIKKLNTAVEKLSNPTRPGESRTEKVAAEGGIEAPVAPDLPGYFTDSSRDAMFTSYGAGSVQPGVQPSSSDLQTQLANIPASKPIPSVESFNNLTAGMPPLPSRPDISDMGQTYNVVDAPLGPGPTYPVVDAIGPVPTAEQIDQLNYQLSTGRHAPLVPYSGIQ